MTTVNRPDVPFAQLLDSLADGVIWLEPVLDQETQTVIDFRVSYHNESAKNLLTGTYNLAPAVWLLRDNPLYHTELVALFGSCARVIETGTPTESDFLTYTHQRLVIRQVKSGNGLVLTLRMGRPTQPVVPTALPSVSLRNILDASRNGIAAYRSLRDEGGAIQDFTLTECNEMARLMLSADAPGQTLLTQASGVRIAELFTALVRVVETGESFQLETPYDHNGRSDWFDISVVRLEDGFVITLANITESRQADRRISLLQSVLDTSLQGIVVYQAIRDSAGYIVDFRVQLINDVAYRQGVTLLSEPAVGRTLKEFSPGSEVDGSFKQFARVCETGVPFQGVKHYPKFDQWADIAVTRFDDGVLVTFANITEIKRAEVLAQQQTGLLNNILDNTNYGIISCTAQRDPAGIVTDFVVQTANRLAVAIIGGTGQTLRGEMLSGIYSVRDEMDLLALCRLATESGRPQYREFNPKATGLERWLAVSATPFNDGLVITLTDITQAKQAVLALEAQTVMLRDVVNGAINGIMLLEAIREPSVGPSDHQTGSPAEGRVTDFRIRAANQATFVMTGIEPEQLVDRRLMDAFSSTKEAGFLDAYIKAIDTREAQRMEAYYPADTNGLEGWFDASAVKQGANGIVLTFFNTTVAKKAELSRQTLITELQRSNANLEQFAYVASHDLQEPLRKVMAFGDVLQDQFAPALGETGVDLVQRMQSAANRMQVLIKDLLVYSRVASKREPFRPIDINRIVADVLVDLETTIAEKAAIIRTDSLPKMPGDALQIRQLFQNLLSNALKFSQPGANPAIQIDCRLVRGEEFGIVPVAESRREFYCIEVADNGIGFEPKYAERIFQVFQRLHGRSQYAGTGIGLAIVQKVVENHKGYIWAEGRPGAGATFRILLPSDVS